MKHASANVRRGMIFITALWIVLILSVMVLLFARSMRVEVVASGNRFANSDANAIEMGAEQWVLSALDNTDGDAVNNENKAAEAIQVGDGYFWILRPDADNPQNYLYGITDEASKLNINVASEAQLVALPNMTYDVADSIIDWRDADNTPTGQGAENDYYQSLPRPYNAKNADFETVEELMLVKGVDSYLMWGSDLNHNGVLEVSEGSPQIATNGVDATRGIFPFVTVYSIESTRDANSQRRVDINQALQQVTQGAGSGGGRTTTQRPRGGRGGAPPPPPGPGGTSGGGAPAAPGGGQQGGGTGDVSQNPLTQILTSGMSQQRAQAVMQAAINQHAISPFRNVFDFAQRTGMKPDELKPIIDRLTTVPRTQSAVKGLVNVNTASRAVFVCLGLQPGDAEQLINQRQSADTSVAGGNNLGWVVDALPLDKLAQIGGNLGSGGITGRSFMYSADILALSGDGRAFKRVRIVVNARQTPAKIVYRKDMTYLGWPLDPQIRDSVRSGQGLPSTVNVSVSAPTAQTR